MFDGATGIQNERIVFSRLLGKRLPLDGKQARFAIFGREIPVGIKTARCDFRGAGREGPLNSTMRFEERIVQAGVIAETAGRYALPFRECVLRAAPTGKKLFAAAEFFCDR